MLNHLHAVFGRLQQLHARALHLANQHQQQSSSSAISLTKDAQVQRVERALVECNYWAAELLNSMSRFTCLHPNIPLSPSFTSSSSSLSPSSSPFPSTWSDVLADLSNHAVQQMQQSPTTITSAHLLTTALQLNWRVGRIAGVS
jgi:hypothetical protein